MLEGKEQSCQYDAHATKGQARVSLDAETKGRDALKGYITGTGAEEKVLVERKEKHGVEVRDVVWRRKYIESRTERAHKQQRKTH